MFLFWKWKYNFDFEIKKIRIYPVEIELFVSSTSQKSCQYEFIVVQLWFWLNIEMSPPTIRQPGDVVNEVYSHNIKTILDLCSEAGDDPTPLIEQTKTELQKMVAEMMAEDDALLERKRAELAPIRVRFESLYHELHPDKSCPQYGTTLPVLQALRTYVDEHKKLKEEHEKLLEREPDLRREERQLCNELNERSLQIDNPSFLNKQLVAQMSLLSEHINELRQEKVFWLRIYSKWIEIFGF